MYGTSYTSCDGNKGLDFLAIVLYDIDKKFVFDVFACEGLVRVSIMATCVSMSWVVIVGEW